MKIPFSVILEVRDSMKELRTLLSKNDFSTEAFAATDKSIVPLAMLNMYIDRVLSELKVEVEHE